MKIQNWAKILISVIVGLATIDFLRGWPWAKRVGAALVKKEDERAS
jgi:hypothetical protein